MRFRRLPIVTIGIIALCFIVQLHTALRGNRRQAFTQRFFDEEALREILLEHPHLKLSEDVERELLAPLEPSLREQLDTERALIRDGRSSEPIRLRFLAEEDPDDALEPILFLSQTPTLALETSSGSAAPPVGLLGIPHRHSPRRLIEHLDRLGALGERAEQDVIEQIAEEAHVLAEQDITRRFGFFAQHPFSLRLLSYPFLHGGWMHLLGNLLVLWLVGFNVEDRWGRLAFPAFYLLGGAVAAWAQTALDNEAHDRALVGASGAIAAVMGVFLLHFASTKIRVFWIHFFRLVPRYGTISVPAYLVLPAWLLNEFFSVGLGGKGEASVAHWAHIGGFCFGFGFGLLLRAIGAEDRFLSGRLANIDVVYEQPPELERARGLLGRGDPQAADTSLEPLFRRQPENEEGLRLRIEARLSLDRATDAQRPFVALIDGLVRGQRFDDAAGVFDEFGPRVSRIGLPPSLWSRFAHQLEMIGHRREARSEYEALIGTHGIDRETLKPLLGYAALLLNIGGEEDRILRVLRKARDLPEAQNGVWAKAIADLTTKAQVRLREAGSAKGRAIDPPAIDASGLLVRVSPASGHEEPPSPE